MPEQLLGFVLLADSLAQRAMLAARPGCSRITRVGELLEPDDTLTIGPPKVESGLVSRKRASSARAVRALAEQIAISVVELAEASARRRSGRNYRGSRVEIELLSSESGDLQQRIARQVQQVEQIDETIELARHESEILQQDVQRGEASWLAAKLRGRDRAARRKPYA